MSCKRDKSEHLHNLNVKVLAKETWVWLKIGNEISDYLENCKSVGGRVSTASSAPPGKYFLFTLRLLKTMWGIRKFIFSPPDLASKPLYLHYHSLRNCLNMLIYPATCWVYLPVFKGSKRWQGTAGERGLVWEWGEPGRVWARSWMCQDSVCLEPRGGGTHCIAGAESTLLYPPFSPASFWSSPHQ